MKKFFLIMCGIFLLIILVYVCNITNIPSNIILFPNENLNIKTLAGINLKKYNSTEGNYETLEASSNLSTVIDDNTKTMELQLSLFDNIFLKKVNVNVIPETTVIPLGSTIGLKLYTAGVLVVGMSEIENKKPYNNSGLTEGDLIVSVNENEVTCTTDLVNEIKSTGGNEVKVEYVRDGQKHATTLTPVKTEDNEYKIGLWVRDSAAGVGTMTFYEPSTGMFAALGHGITDVDTEELITISKGEIVSTKILDIQKGEKGTPGELKGSIINQATLGQISKNTRFGIFGTLNNLTSLNLSSGKEYNVAMRDEIQEGAAKIICALDGKNQDEYDIEIQKIYKNNNENNKSMVIKITDTKLLEKTGGIIQGMSGAPIIQNGKFVGAVTHVFVSDPTMGYGIFGDLMIKQMRET